MTEFADELFFDRPSPIWSFVLRFGLGAVLALFYLTVSLHFQYTPDDTYIYLQYARNIARGDGFAFNAGQPSYGITGPFWALLIAAGAAAKLDPYVVAKTFDLLFACLTLLLAHMLTFLLTRDRLYAIIGALLVAVDAWLLRWSGSGMEVSLAAFLCLMSVRYLITREHAIAAFGAGLLTLVRPEGFLLLLIIVLEGARHSWNDAARWKRLGFVALFASMPLVPWIAYALVKFGTIIPNTYAAKTEIAFSWQEAAQSAWMTIRIIGATQAVPVLLLAGGGLFYARTHGWRALWDDCSAAAVVPLLVLAYAAMNAGVLSRYVLPFLPLVPVFALWALKHVELHFQWQMRRIVMALTMLAALACGQNAIVYGSTVLPHIVQFTQGMEECFRPMGYWLDAHAEPDAVVLAHDIGLVGYLSDRTFYDTPGLITPQVRKAFGSVPPDDALAAGLYASVVRPDYLIDRSARRERLADSIRIPVFTRAFPGLGIRAPDSTYYTIYRMAQ